jgi:hypothetical protein
MAIAVVLLTGAWASAQSQKDSKKGANPPAATTGNAASQADTSGASGQKGKSGGGTQNVQSIPHFKDNQNPGSMPQSEIRDSADKGPAGTQPASPEDLRYRPGNNKTTKTEAPNGAATVEYKDPEDMTTRYRPGNNKTTKAPAAGANKNHETVEYKDPEDMTTRTKAAEGKAQKPN